MPETVIILDTSLRNKPRYYGEPYGEYQPEGVIVGTTPEGKYKVKITLSTNVMREKGIDIGHVVEVDPTQLEYGSLELKKMQDISYIERLGTENLKKETAKLEQSQGYIILDEKGNPIASTTKEVYEAAEAKSQGVGISTKYGPGFVKNNKIYVAVASSISGGELGMPLSEYEKMIGKTQISEIRKPSDTNFLQQTATEIEEGLEKIRQRVEGSTAETNPVGIAIKQTAFTPPLLLAGTIRNIGDIIAGEAKFNVETKTIKLDETQIKKQEVVFIPSQYQQLKEAQAKAELQKNLANNPVSTIATFGLTTAGQTLLFGGIGSGIKTISTYTTGYKPATKTGIVLKTKEIVEPEKILIEKTENFETAYKVKYEIGATKIKYLELKPEGEFINVALEKPFVVTKIVKEKPELEMKKTTVYETGIRTTTYGGAQATQEFFSLKGKKTINLEPTKKIFKIDFKKAEEKLLEKERTINSDIKILSESEQQLANLEATKIMKNILKQAEGKGTESVLSYRVIQTKEPNVFLAGRPKEDINLRKKEIITPLRYRGDMPKIEYLRFGEPRIKIIKGKIGIEIHPKFIELGKMRTEPTRAFIRSIIVYDAKNLFKFAQKHGIKFMIGKSGRMSADLTRVSGRLLSQLKDIETKQKVPVFFRAVIKGKELKGLIMNVGELKFRIPKQQLKGVLVSPPKKIKTKISETIKIKQVGGPKKIIIGEGPKYKEFRNSKLIPLPIKKTETKQIYNTYNDQNIISTQKSSEFSIMDKITRSKKDIDHESSTKAILNIQDLHMPQIQSQKQDQKILSIQRLENLTIPQKTPNVTKLHRFDDYTVKIRHMTLNANLTNKKRKQGKMSPILQKRRKKSLIRPIADEFSKTIEEAITGKPAKDPAGKKITTAFIKEMKIRGAEIFPTAKQIKTGKIPLFGAKPIIKIKRGKLL